MYKTECPKCGGDLWVVSLSWYGRVPLCQDGFAFDDAKESNTEDELVECGDCGREYKLHELYSKERKRG